MTIISHASIMHPAWVVCMKPQGALNDDPSNLDNRYILGGYFVFSHEKTPEQIVNCLLNYMQTSKNISHPMGYTGSPSGEVHAISTQIRIDGLILSELKRSETGALRVYRALGLSSYELKCILKLAKLDHSPGARHEDPYLPGRWACLYKEASWASQSGKAHKLQMSRAPMAACG